MSNAFEPSQYHEIIMQSSHGYALLRMVYAPDGGLDDFLVEEANDTFGELTCFSVSAIIGRSGRELWPYIFQGEGQLVRRLAAVARGEGRDALEHFFSASGRWARGQIFPPR